MATACYFPSGNDTGSTYIPCNQTAVANGEHSACCAPNDMCFTNGLCKANPDNWNWNWRVGCTDQTWKDPACPNYCRGIEQDDQAHVIFQCQDNGTWCCATGDPNLFARNYNFTCCDISGLTFKAAAVVYTHASVSLAITSLTSSDSSSSETSFLSSPTTNVQPQPTSLSVSGIAASTTASVTQTAASLNATVTGSKPPALAIGLGVGIPLAIILIAIACFAFWRLGQRQSQRASAQAKEDLAKEHSISEVHSIPTHSVPPLGREQRRTLMSNLEIDGEELKAEMPYSNSPVELEGPTNKLPSRPSSAK